MSILGRELAPAVAIGRPRLRNYPGPAVATIVFIPFAALTALGFLTFRASRSPGFYWFVAFCTAFMLVGAVTMFLIWLRFGLTMALHELGVVLVTRGKEHEIRYADIDAITVYDKRRYDETATVRMMTRTITIEAAGETVVAQYVAMPNDILDDLLLGLAQRIAAVPRPRAGNGWTIEQASVHAHGKSIPLSSITAAGVFEREVRLWKQREEKHFLSVPWDSKNARVLLLIAANQATQAHAYTHAPEEPQPVSGIGRLLFARRTTLISGVGNTVFAASGILMVWAFGQKYHVVTQQVANGVCFGLSVLWILYSIYRATVLYRFHERALVRISLLGTRTIAYANVAAMKWHESAQSLEHAIPMGTTVKAKLIPDDGSAPVSIRFHRFRGNDGDLEPVRSSIANHIAKNLHRRLQQGEEVPWTGHSKFTREGLILKAVSFAKPVLVRYDEHISVTQHRGMLILWRDGKLLTELTPGDNNFFPGLALFEMVMQDLSIHMERTA